MEQPFRLVGRRLAATREALGITQAELCRQLRVDPPRWNPYELASGVSPLRWRWGYGLPLG